MIEKARILLDGQIDLDPASSFEFNKLVNASMYYTEQLNGLIQLWAGNVFLNPPGGKIKKFWEKLIKHVLSGDVTKAFWVGFSVEQLCLLSDQEYGPLDFSTCILRKRVHFNNETLGPGDSPSHGNFVVGLGVDKLLFEQLFTGQGKIVHGVYS